MRYTQKRNRQQRNRRFSSKRRRGGRRADEQANNGNAKVLDQEGDSGMAGLFGQEEEPATAAENTAPAAPLDNSSSNEYFEINNGVAVEKAKLFDEDYEYNILDLESNIDNILTIIKIAANLKVNIISNEEKTGGKRINKRNKKFKGGENDDASVNEKLNSSIDKLLSIYLFTKDALDFNKNNEIAKKYIEMPIPNLDLINELRKISDLKDYINEGESFNSYDLCKKINIIKTLLVSTSTTYLFFGKSLNDKFEDIKVELMLKRYSKSKTQYIYNNLINNEGSELLKNIEKINKLEEIEREKEREKKERAASLDRFENSINTRTDTWKDVKKRRLNPKMMRGGGEYSCDTADKLLEIYKLICSLVQKTLKNFHKEYKSIRLDAFIDSLKRFAPYILDEPAPTVEETPIAAAAEPPVAAAATETSVAAAAVEETPVVEETPIVTAPEKKGFFSSMKDTFTKDRGFISSIKKDRGFISGFKNFTGLKGGSRRTRKRAHRPRRHTAKRSKRTRHHRRRR